MLQDHFALIICSQKAVEEGGKKKWIWKAQAASFKSAPENGMYFQVVQCCFVLLNNLALDTLL
jgi:hypothetical protein